MRDLDVQGQRPESERAADPAKVPGKQTGVTGTAGPGGSAVPGKRTLVETGADSFEGAVADARRYTEELQRALAAGDQAKTAQMAASLETALAIVRATIGTGGADQGAERMGATAELLAHAEPLLARTRPPSDDVAKFASAQQQQSDVNALEGGTASKEQREHLAAELRRQVPDIALLDAVRTGDAKTVISVVTPGGGDTGIKRMNDELIGYQLNSNRLMPARNKIIKEAFEAQGFKVVDQNYKTTTFVSDKVPAETTAGMAAASKQIDAHMKPLLEQVLAEGIQHFKADLAKRTPPDPEIEIGQSRIKKMEALRTKIGSGESFQFDFQMGAAELQGGKDASYEQVLGAEMNASKAAIMARDTSFTPEQGAAGGRAMVFHEAEFVAFAKETVAIKEQLASASLPYHGQRVAVFEGGTLNRDILRAVRKGSYNEQLDPQETKTLESVKQYFTRVNSLDYITHFTGDEVGAQGLEVGEAAALVAQLESDKPIAKEAANQIAATLAQGTPQAGAANEAQFYGKAAALHDRIVLNADIKDMGLDLFAGYEKSMDAIGRNPKANVNAVSRHASDGIVDFKRNAVKAFQAFYAKELLPKAKELAKQQNRQDLLEVLANEAEPLMLLGGDEITVSLPRAFAELNLVSEAVAKLTSPDVANARVAVTRGSGAEGHASAMKSAQGGQDLLKKDFEPLARDLRTKASTLAPEQAAHAVTLADRIDRLYTEERDGKTLVIDASGTVVEPAELKAQVATILEMKQ